ncbi:MAG: hypothetical protein ACRDYW_03160 [Acidimicrobiales bacterium]
MSTAVAVQETLAPPVVFPSRFPATIAGLTPLIVTTGAVLQRTASQRTFMLLVVRVMSETRSHLLPVADTLKVRLANVPGAVGVRDTSIVAVGFALDVSSVITEPSLTCVSQSDGVVIVLSPAAIDTVALFVASVPATSLTLTVSTELGPNVRPLSVAALRRWIATVIVSV